MAKETRKAIEEIAQLKTKLYVVAGKIDSLEHLVRLDRSVMEKLRKKVDKFNVIVNASKVTI